MTCLPIRDVKLVLRARGALSRHGLADVPVGEAALAFRRKCIEEMGTRQYLYKLLGARANRRVGRVGLWRGDDRLEVPSRWRDCRLVDYLTRFGPVEMPDRVEFSENGQQVTFHI